MLGQVVIGTVCDAPKLTPAKREQELKVRGGLGVEAQLLGRVVPHTQVLVLLADAQQPVVAEGPPVLEPLHIGTRLTEELQLHLLKLSGTEGKVTRCDLISE